MATRPTTRFDIFYRLALRLLDTAEGDALLLLVDSPADWGEIEKGAKKQKIVIAADEVSVLDGAAESGLDTIVLDMAGQPVHEKLSQALIECVADDILEPGGRVVAVYSGFEASQMDSVSLIQLDEHLGRLTARDLRALETKVPLDTLKTVVDLAVEIGREGREGKPVGTLFVVGDARKVMASSHSIGFDPVKGYSRKERSLGDRRVREGTKEIAQMDGAFVVGSDGTIESAVRYIDAPAADITLSKGLGSRHWAAAAISKATNAVAVAVSESNGTVRLFQNGEIVLRIEPLRRPMTWKEFEFESRSE